MWIWHEWYMVTVNICFFIETNFSIRAYYSLLWTDAIRFKNHNEAICSQRFPSFFWLERKDKFYEFSYMVTVSWPQVSDVRRAYVPGWTYHLRISTRLTHNNHLFQQLKVIWKYLFVEIYITHILNKFKQYLRILIWNN